MSDLKEYVNKCSYQIDFDDEDDIYIARCAELSSVMAHGKTHEAALKEIKVAILNTLEWMLQNKGERLPEPLSLHKFSGNYPLRMPPEKHRKLAIEASFQGVSLNQFIINKL